MTECRDVLIVPSGHPELPEDAPPKIGPDDTVVLGQDLTIEMLDDDLADKVFDACAPAGYEATAPDHRFSPIRQFGQRHSFVRRRAPDDPLFEWDPDSRIAMALAVSRLIQPTSIGYEYAARVILGGDGSVRTVVPGPVAALGAHAYVDLTDGRSCLARPQAEELAAVLAGLEWQRLPERIQRAFWTYQYATYLSELEVRIPLLVTAIEALIHVNDRTGSTRQFRMRTTALAREVGVPGFDEARSEQLYGQVRSALVHGQRIDEIARGPSVDLNRDADTIVRKVLLRALRDTAFAATFASEEEIRRRFGR